MANKTDTIESVRQEIKGYLNATVGYAMGPEDESDSSPRKKSGGQPGNQNARKHGLYSKVLTPEQLEAFQDVCNQKYLQKEVALLRFMIEDLLAQPDPDVKLVLRTMGTLGRLIRVDDRLRYGT